MTKQPGDRLNQIHRQALDSLAEVSKSAELESWRVRWLGRKGEVTGLLRSIKNMAMDDRKVTGKLGNKIKRELTDLYEEKRVVVGASETGRLDVSPRSISPVPGQQALGHLNPLTSAFRSIYVIFSELGFQLAEGPLAEEAKYNFDLLNIPLEHPARAETDTFYLDSGKVLRTHTSPVQLRAVLEENLVPPFKIFSPGRTFRAERTDASHDHTFHQVECLMVDKDISIADFKGVVEYLLTKFYEQEVTTRLRPSYFPFVEPGFEVDMGCILCKQQGCSACQRTGWLEMMGAGMVHPNVLKNMNLDPSKYQGFAFGVGIDRLAMLRHGIGDVRLFLSGDLKFLRQF